MHESGMEGMRLNQETSELTRNPREVFDSNPKSADAESKKIRRLISPEKGLVAAKRQVEVYVAPEKVTGQAENLYLLWPRNDEYATGLILQPVSEGSGAEAGVMAYTGQYGVAQKEQGHWQFMRDQCVSLDKAFGVPKGLTLMVKPTVHRWSIGRDELSMLYGENVRTLHLGLGLLLLGEQWLYIGRHEAGHLPNTHDENEAWSKANSGFASLHHKRHKEIVAGADSGLFDILQKPLSRPRYPTIGKVMQYGLTSHYLAGNADIPKIWQDSAEKTMRHFSELILDAQSAFDSTFHPPHGW